MIRIAQILCPVDFSEVSRHALDHAAAGDAWKAAAEDWFRQRLLLRVRAYLADGHAGLPSLDDHETA
jgi:hypothetical protein